MMKITFLRKKAILVILAVLIILGVIAVIAIFNLNDDKTPVKAVYVYKSSKAGLSFFL